MILPGPFLFELALSLSFRMPIELKLLFFILSGFLLEWLDLDTKLSLASLLTMSCWLKALTTLSSFTFFWFFCELVLSATLWIWSTEGDCRTGPLSDGPLATGSTALKLNDR